MTTTRLTEIQKEGEMFDMINEQEAEMIRPGEQNIIKATIERFTTKGNPNKKQAQRDIQQVNSGLKDMQQNSS